MEPIKTLEQKELDELLEEELKEKKNAENFLIAAIEKKKAEKQVADRIKESNHAALLSNSSSAKTYHSEAQHLADNFRAARNALDETFKLEGSPKAVAEVNRALAHLDLNRHSFSAIALGSVASTGVEGEETFRNIAEKTHKGLTPSTKYAEICKKACLITKDAIISYKNGDPKALGTILGAGIRNACYQFATTLDRKDAIKWSNYIEDILPALEKDENLFKASGLSKDELHAANGAVQIGCLFKRGFKALDEMTSAQINNKQLSTERFVELTAHITAMEFASFQRESEVSEWLKKPEKEKGQHLNSGVQQFYGSQGVSCKEARIGVISDAQIEMILEISQSKIVKDLAEQPQRESIVKLADSNKRKLLMKDVFAKMNPSKKAQISVPSKDKVLEKGALKKEDVLLPKGPSLSSH